MNKQISTEICCQIQTISQNRRKTEWCSGHVSNKWQNTNAQASVSGTGDWGSSFVSAFPSPPCSHWKDCFSRVPCRKSSREISRDNRWDNITDCIPAFNFIQCTSLFQLSKEMHHSQGNASFSWAWLPAQSACEFFLQMASPLTNFFLLAPRHGNLPSFHRFWRLHSRSQGAGPSDFSAENDMLSDGFSRKTKSRITQCLGLCISEGQPLMRGAYTGTPKRWSSVFSEPISLLGCLYPVSY